MITRKLLAALVGVSLAAGTLGAASAQTSVPPTTEMAAPTTDRSASPADAMRPATAKAEPMKKATARKAHKAHMSKAVHRKHVSARATKATEVAAKHAGKRVRVSHAEHRTTTQG